MRNEASTIMGDGDIGTEWYQHPDPPSSPVGSVQHASDAENAVL